MAETTVPYTLADGTTHNPDSALAEFTYAVQNALRAVGMDPDIRLTLESVVRKGSFKEVETRDIVIPLGEWPTGPLFQSKIEAELLNLSFLQQILALERSGDWAGRLLR